nr:MAG TPA: hypothetical protein [Caudoviricetes sp.]
MPLLYNFSCHLANAVLYLSQIHRGRRAPPYALAVWCCVPEKRKPLTY